VPVACHSHVEILFTQLCTSIVHRIESCPFLSDHLASDSPSHCEMGSLPGALQ
jgi:hypothetical protein